MGFFHFGTNPDDMFYTSQADVTHVTDYAHALRQEREVWESKDKSFRLVAVLDLQLVEKVRIETGVNIIDGSEDAKKMMKKVLNDGEYAAFRISKGRI